MRPEQTFPVACDPMATPRYGTYQAEEDRLRVSLERSLPTGGETNRITGDQVVRRLPGRKDQVVADSDCCSTSREMPSVTVGVALLRHSAAVVIGREVHRAFIVIVSEFDPQIGWADTADSPSCNIGLWWTIDSILAHGFEEWAGHTVYLRWELDPATRAEAERLALSLPLHLHVDPFGRPIQA